MIGRIYVGYHLTLSHTEYTGFRPCGFREENCFVHVIHIISLLQIMMHPGRGQFRPRGMVGRCYKGFLKFVTHKI